MSLFPTQETCYVTDGMVIFRRMAAEHCDDLLAEIDRITERSRFRRMMTPMRRSMSVEMTNTGKVGWISDESGYRYVSSDPLTGRSWPAMPKLFRKLACQAARSAGHAVFDPDVCLINRYSPGSAMGLHRDADERDFSSPIVSISLGLSARFKVGGRQRSDRTFSVVLEHGDVMVFGGPARLIFHAIGKLRQGVHPVVGSHRINLTFRRAL